MHWPSFFSVTLLSLYCLFYKLKNVEPFSMVGVACLTMCERKEAKVHCLCSCLGSVKSTWIYLAHWPLFSSFSGGHWVHRGCMRLALAFKPQQKRRALEPPLTASRSMGESGLETGCLWKKKHWEEMKPYFTHFPKRRMNGLISGCAQEISYCGDSLG